MLLTNFSVSNYRSITTAHRIQMSNMTVLVGRNSEGKSNILRALSLAMDVMKYCNFQILNKIILFDSLTNAFRYFLSYFESGITKYTA